MKLHHIAVLVIFTLLSAGVRADVLGWRIGGNGWLQNFEGDAEANGPSLDLENDLGYDDEFGFNLYVQFEHPVPLLPNVRLDYTEIDTDGRGQVNGASFDGTLLNGDVASSLDLTYTDVTLYYELLDNWVNIDLGASLRLFDEGLEITDRGTGDKGSLDMDDYYPMLRRDPI